MLVSGTHFEEQGSSDVNGWLSGGDSCTWGCSSNGEARCLECNSGQSWLGPSAVCHSGRMHPSAVWATIISHQVNHIPNWLCLCSAALQSVLPMAVSDFLIANLLSLALHPLHYPPSYDLLCLLSFFRTNPFAIPPVHAVPSSQNTLPLPPLPSPHIYLLPTTCCYSS